MKIRSDSKEYYRVQVDANPQKDLRTLDVYIAFVAAGETLASGDWTLASWETDGPPYVARILVGTGGDIALPSGDYTTHVRVVDAPQDIWKDVGSLTVY